MARENDFVLWYKDVSIADVPLVGGKNAALGEMISNLGAMGIDVPNGFAITASAYNHFLESAGLKEKIEKIMSGVDTTNMRNLQKNGALIRKMIVKANLPKDLENLIAENYKKLGEMYFANVDVAVRSSATAEDLPGASFAGQQETYLNVSGISDILYSVKMCFASLFNDRAISYRQDKGFSHTAVSLSVGIQKMVRSDLASSGVAFSIDTETGFDKVVVINSSYGLGEMVVQGKVTPDEFIVFKPTLEQGFNSIIVKNCGPKEIKMIYSGKKVKTVAPTHEESNAYSLSDPEIVKLAQWVVKIEKYFSEKHGHYQPMDTEWAKDGQTGKLFIVQARPETVYSTADKKVYKEYRLGKKSKVLVAGTPVGSQIASGKVRIIRDVKKIGSFQKGDVLVTEITDPDWEPIMKIASAIVTDKGGRTSHAAIVSRELGITCVVGTMDATKKLHDGQEVTVDCTSAGAGAVFEGVLPFEIIEHKLDKVPETKTKIMVNIGSPDEAFEKHQLPVQGVGLGRLEFIITEHIKTHPNALLDFEKIKAENTRESKELVAKIEALTVGYKNKTDFYVEELAEGISRIGAAFYPHDVIIRFSDFKTNEYRTLLGGDRYEPSEENPMIGWRGASRYYHPKFKDAFGLECLAIKRVRDVMGLKNVIPMIPFCRTVEEGKAVLEIMKAHGLDRTTDKTLKVYIMCEIPSNVLMAEEFLAHFDGMSIGSNDLTQLTLGLDRDSGIVNSIANENNPAVKKLIGEIIEICKRKGKYIGICGQAPSDFPDFATFLVEKGIESISLNPDTVIKTLLAIAEKEKQIGK